MTIKKVCSPLHKISKQFYRLDIFNPGHDAISHISANETIAEQLRNMGEPQTRLQICTKIIYTLPEHHRGFISVWESLSEEEQTIPLVTAEILNEESKKAMFKPHLTLGTTLLLTEVVVADKAMAEEVSLVETEATMVHQLLRNLDTTGHSVTIVNLEVSSPTVHSLNAGNTHTQ